jgi:hypothetical protein
MDERYKDENLKEHLDEMDRLKAEAEKTTIKEDAEEVSDNAGDFIDDGLSTLTEKTGNLFSGMKDMASDGLSSVKDMGSSVVAGATGLAAGATEIVSGGIEKVADLGTGITEGVGDAVAGAGDAVSSVAENVVDAGSSVVELAKDVASGAGDAVSAVTGNVVDAGSGVVEEITEGAGGLVSGATDAISGGVEGAGDALSSVADGVKDAGSSVVDAGSGVLSGAALAVGAVASGLVGGAKDIGKSATNFASDAANTGKKSLNEVLGNQIQNDAPAVLRPKEIFSNTPEAPPRDYEPINQKITTILETLKNNRFSQDYGILMYLIAFPIVVLAIWQFIQSGLSLRIGVLILLGIFFLLYRGAVKGVTRDVFSLKSKVQTGGATPLESITSKIEYVLSGIELNLKRISYTKWLYTLFTPFLLFGAAELWKGPFDTKTSFWLFLIGFAFCFIIWPLAFKSDVKKLQELELDLMDVKREL